MSLREEQIEKLRNSYVVSDRLIEAAGLIEAAENEVRDTTVAKFQSAALRRKAYLVSHDEDGNRQYIGAAFVDDIDGTLFVEVSLEPGSPLGVMFRKRMGLEETE